MKTSWTVGVMLLVQTAFTRLAEASVVTYQFGGTVTSVSDPYGLLPASILAGTSAFSGTLSYDDAVPDNDPQTWRGFYHTGELSVLIDGAFGFATTALPVGPPLGNNGTTIENTSFDGFQILRFDPAGSTSFNAGLAVNGMTLFLADTDHNLFASDGLTGLNLDLSSFEIRLFRIFGTVIGNESQSFLIDGEVTSLQAQSTVPEPSCLALFGIPIVGMAFRATYRRRMPAKEKGEALGHFLYSLRPLILPSGRPPHSHLAGTTTDDVSIILVG